jgi:hypothetical protein
MLAYGLAIIAFFGFLASLSLHAMTFLGYSNVILATSLLAMAILFGFPGILVYPFQVNYTFLHLIPKKLKYVSFFIMLYGIGGGIITAILVNEDRYLPDPYGSRIALGMSMAIFFYHWLGYWHHSPLEFRAKLISVFKRK